MSEDAAMIAAGAFIVVTLAGVGCGYWWAMFRLQRLIRRLRVDARARDELYRHGYHAALTDVRRGASVPR